MDQRTFLLPPCSAMLADQPRRHAGQSGAPRTYRAGVAVCSSQKETHDMHTISMVGMYVCRM